LNFVDGHRGHTRSAPNRFHKGNDRLSRFIVSYASECLQQSKRLICIWIWSHARALKPDGVYRTITGNATLVYRFSAKRAQEL